MIKHDIDALINLVQAANKMDASRKEAVLDRLRQLQTHVTDLPDGQEDTQRNLRDRLCDFKAAHPHLSHWIDVVLTDLSQLGI